MKRPYLLLATCLFIALTAPSAAAFPGDSLRNAPVDSDLTPLNNQDIVAMLERKIATDAIIKVIQTSPCTFDIFPPVLREMKRRGVPESVLQAMVEAPYGPTDNSVGEDREELAQQPIYHYIEQLKQMGFVLPSVAQRRTRTRQGRARVSRPRQRS